MSEAATLPVLIVDDDEPTQKLLQAVIRRAGLPTELAEDSARAIELLSHNEFSAVVLDVMMPGASGRAVVDFIANREHKPPVIICTAGGVRAIAGMDEQIVRAVVHKPFDIDTLMVTVVSLATGKAP